MEDKKGYEEIIKLLNNLQINDEGLITTENFYQDFAKQKKLFKTSKIKDSYLPSTKEWKFLNKEEIGIGENEIFQDYELILIRITEKNPKDYIKILSQEFKLNQSIKDLEIVIKFIGYTKSNRETLSIFTSKEFKILKEVLNQDKKDLINKLYGAIQYLQDEDNNLFLICPNLSPNNILWIDEKIYFTEIFLSTKSIDENIDFELQPQSIWCPPEIKGRKSKVSFASNICSLGYLLYKIITKIDPFKDIKERKNNKIPNLLETNFELKKIIELCIQIDPSKRPSLSEISDNIEDVEFNEENIEDIDSISHINHNSNNLEENTFLSKSYESEIFNEKTEKEEEKNKESRGNEENENKTTINQIQMNNSMEFSILKNNKNNHSNDKLNKKRVKMKKPIQFQKYVKKKNQKKNM